MLDVARPKNVAQIIFESKRVSKNVSTLIAGFFSPSAHIKDIGNEIGFFSENCQFQLRLFDIWNAQKDSTILARLIAEWTDSPIEEGRGRVIEYKRELHAIHDEVDLLARELNRRSLSPESILRKALDFKIMGCSIQSALQIFDNNGLQEIKHNYEASISTLTLTGKWKSE